MGGCGEGGRGRLHFLFSFQMVLGNTAGKPWRPTKKIPEFILLAAAGGPAPKVMSRRGGFFFFFSRVGVCRHPAPGSWGEDSLPR